MPLGPFSTWDECHEHMMRQGHSDEEANRICGAMEQGASSSSQGIGELHALTDMSAEEQSQKVELSGSELNDVTQGLTDAKALAEASGDATAMESIQKAYDIIYSKMEVSVEGDEAAPPF